MKITTLLPFMESEELKELAYKILDKEVKGVSIVTLFPFLDKEDLTQVFDKMIETGHTKKLYGALPFLNKEQINKLYDRVKAGELEGFKEAALIPFLGETKIKEIFNELVKEAANAEDVADEDDEFDVEDEE